MMRKKGIEVTGRIIRVIRTQGMRNGSETYDRLKVKSHAGKLEKRIFLPTFEFGLGAWKAMEEKKHSNQRWKL